jgi:hypothetical protein
MRPIYRVGGEIYRVGGIGGIGLVPQLIQSIRVVSLNLNDDDLRIRAAGVTLSDTRLRANQYYGETVVSNPLWATEGFRIVTITDASAREMGVSFYPGMEVFVDVYNFSGNVRTGQYDVEATYWPSGTASVIGGTVANLGSQPDGAYFENGSVVLPEPP